jgi:hypothetical protein
VRLQQLCDVARSASVLLIGGRCHTVDGGDAGAYRQPIGSDVLVFFGANAANVTVRPRLEVIITGRAIPVPAPPAPLYPVGKVGTIVDGGTDSVEVTCDGGKVAWIATPPTTQKRLLQPHHHRQQQQQHPCCFILSHCDL